MPTKLEDRIFEDAKIMFRNFGGREGPYNSLGDRNFVLFVDEDTAERMLAEGWNVKRLRPQEGEEVGQAYIPVAVEYNKGRPPKVVIITTSKGRLEFGVEDVPMLDYADIKQVDIILNPFPWEVNGKTGVKAYLKKAFITLNEDALELKYADVEDAQTPTMSSTVSEED